MEVSSHDEITDNAEAPPLLVVIYISGLCSVSGLYITERNIGENRTYRLGMLIIWTAGVSDMRLPYF